MTKLTKAVGEPKEVATFAAKSPDDEEIGTTLPTHCSSDVAESDTMNAVTTKDNKTSYGDFTASAGTDNTIRNSVGKDLVWSDVNMRLLDKKTGNVKLDILKNAWGRAEAGKTTAIMGASGAGKTSLFQTLAGRVPTSSKLQVEGQIYLGALPFNPRVREHRKMIAYVAQEDALHETSTPREALLFSARLRLPKSMKDEDCREVAERTLIKLGLESCADTLIGGRFLKGISGGEKRRVSIGVELTAKPSLIFLDEPTSGLDSFAAKQVMKLLKHFAHDGGNTVLFTVHQPSSNIFTSFDQLILLHKGQVMHQGSVDTIGEDYERYGYPVPNWYNPADWVIDVAQENSMEDLQKSEHGFFADAPKDLLLPIVNKNDVIAPVVVQSNDSVSSWKELVMLQQREIVSLHRNPVPILINVGVTGTLSCIFGVIFLDVGRQDRSDFSVIQSQLGAIVNILISTLMGQSNPAMLTFSKDRPVFLREYSTDHYTVIPYFLAKLGTEAFNTLISTMTQAIVIYWLMGFSMSFGQLVAITYSLSLTATAVTIMMGACFTDINNAMSLFTLVVVPQFYFSGLFIAIELIPEWVSWAQYLCSLTYAARLGFAYEFGGDCGDAAAQQNCDTILAANNVHVDDTWWYWLALLGLFVMFRLGGIVVLRFKATY